MSKFSRSFAVNQSINDRPILFKDIVHGTQFAGGMEIISNKFKNIALRGLAIRQIDRTDKQPRGVRNRFHLATELFTGYTRRIEQASHRDTIFAASQGHDLTEFFRIEEDFVKVAVQVRLEAHSSILYERTVAQTTPSACSTTGSGAERTSNHWMLGSSCSQVLENIFVANWPPLTSLMRP